MRIPELLFQTDTEFAINKDVKEVTNLSKAILIVNPDVRLRKKWELMFTKEDYTVETADGVTDAVQKLSTQKKFHLKFDCVIMAVKLPELSNEPLLQCHPDFIGIPIIKAIAPSTKIIITVDENSSELEAEIRKQNIFYYHIISAGQDDLRLAVQNALQS